MYLAIDIGGTKTLVACFDAKGQLKNEVKFATPSDYEAWLEHCKAALTELKCDDFKAGCVAIPGTADRHNGVGINFGNLSWLDVPIARDVERLTNCPIVIENDAKLAGLAEANLIKKDFKKILYITFGTGIGISYIVDGVIDLHTNDLGGAVLTLEHGGKRVPWDKFASGHAIVRRFGKEAGDITDQAIWKEITHDFSVGILDLIAIFQPDVVVIGGGVGVYFDRFGKLLEAALKQYETPLLHIPPLKQAKHQSKAVLYGCYELTKVHYAAAHR